MHNPLTANSRLSRPTEKQAAPPSMSGGVRNVPTSAARRRHARVKAGERRLRSSHQLVGRGPPVGSAGLPGCTSADAVHWRRRLWSWRRLVVASGVECTPPLASVARGRRVSRRHRRASMVLLDTMPNRGAHPPHLSPWASHVASACPQPPRAVDGGGRRSAVHTPTPQTSDGDAGGTCKILSPRQRRDSDVSPTQRDDRRRGRHKCASRGSPPPPQAAHEWITRDALSTPR